MNLTPDLEKRYTTKQLTAPKAWRLAQQIAFAPIAFQVSRLMVKPDIFSALPEAPEGFIPRQIADATKLSAYAVQILLGASLSIGTVIARDDRLLLTRAGWFLLCDKTTQVNMNSVQEVCYLGLNHLEEVPIEGKPAGLKVFGPRPTIYKGLSELPAEAQQKWFAFDHYYPDYSSADALNLIFKEGVHTLLDVGGNAGRLVLRCVGFNPKVQVTIMNLSQRLNLMQEHVKGKRGTDRIYAYPANLLDPTVSFPTGFDVIWMSQLLDCFSPEEVTGILKHAATAMTADNRLYIPEAYWDRQQYETGTYCLAQISVCFTVMANGNSKMYYSQDMIDCAERVGLKVETIYGHFDSGNSHTLFKIRR